MKNILVSDIMSRDFVAISPATNLMECAKKMVQKKTRSLLIAENNRLIGFLSQRDILWALTKKPNQDLTKIKAIEISPKKIAVIKPDSTISEAIEKMKRLKFEKLPVVQGNKLVGVLRTRDILNFQPDIYPEMNELEKIKGESEKLEKIKKTEKTRDGICEECGHEGILFKVNGMLVCESCRDSI
ncbi:MAG: CBS domain-containing protein [Candidatus Nanoarchaeia archaeon]|nr:CBS domain-containing protein [Candidatus Nanoarchaeia archaeon]MDD5357814.1 CBS domain-containing protein [Candidatus Nanoarchaeia archaeon]MDD5588733.1 CBS domain-containing protein [Candidatus Nanoarchaeia archaeon]